MFVFRIREIRIEKNLSLEKLSRKSSVNLAYLSQLERGEKQNPSINLLYDIATALSVNIKELFYTKEDISDLQQKMYLNINQNGFSDEKNLKIGHLIDSLINLAN